MKRAQLEAKSIFNLEEAILFYGLNRKKLKQLLDGNGELPFVAIFRKQK